MSRPYLPPRPQHRFDLVAYDGQDKPLLIVEIKRNSEIPNREQFIRDTMAYVDASRRPAPFFIIADEQSIYLYHKNRETGAWTQEGVFDSKFVLCHYDKDFGASPVYEHYLASLIQVWLNDIADNWHSQMPPKVEVFQQLGLIDALHEGSLAVDASL